MEPVRPVAAGAPFGGGAGGARPRRAAQGLREGRRSRLRPALRRHVVTGRRARRPGRPRPGAGRGGRPGGLPRHLEDLGSVRPGEGEPARVAPDHRAPQGRGPGPVRGGVDQARHDLPRAEPADRPRLHRRGSHRLDGSPPGRDPPFRASPPSSARPSSSPTSAATHTRRWRPCSSSRSAPPRPASATGSSDFETPWGWAHDRDIHALSGAYAVDALDDIERAQFERHLAECPACTSEVASLREAAALLAETTMTTPSAGAPRPGAVRHQQRPSAPAGRGPSRPRPSPVPPSRPSSPAGAVASSPFSRPPQRPSRSGPEGSSGSS